MSNRWLVAGLGNPGSKYEVNRHNAGFLFLDYVAAKIKAGTFNFQKALQGGKATGNIGTVPVVLLKPDTFMNLSGHSVQGAISFFKILSENAIICYDDVDIPFGTFRIRNKGSAGGHNGLSSVIEHVGPSVIRFRIGVGTDRPRSGDLAGYVLGDFHREELDILADLFDDMYKALRMVVSGNVARAMNSYNRKKCSNCAGDDEEKSL
jgi:PTH1 family peptidyl-tRNA hydrolase